MYFREDVVAYLTQHADQTDGLGIASVPQDRASPLEQLPKSSLAGDPTLRQADAGALTSPALVTVGTALTQRPDAPQSELSKPGEEMVSNSMHYARPLGEAQEDETSATTELRQSLQQAQDKILTLENELALVRQHNAHASLSPRQARHIPQRRLKKLNRQSFFGVFNFVPNRAPVQPRPR
jgi:hypothetical protein